MTYHKAIHLVGTVTVGPKGQVVIPSEVRESMEINPGDKLVALYLEEKNRWRLSPSAKPKNT